MALCLALALLPLYLEKRMMVGAVLLCLVALLSLGAAYFLAKGRPRTALLSLLAPALALYTAVGLTFANVANLFPAMQVMKNLPRPRNCEQMEFVSSGYEEPSIVFLTGTATKFLPGAEAAAAMAGSKCTLGIIDSTQEDSFLRRVAELGRRARKIKVYDGLNPANSKRILLTVYELQ